MILFNHVIYADSRLSDEVIYLKEKREINPTRVVDKGVSKSVERSH